MPLKPAGNFSERSPENPVELESSLQAGASEPGTIGCYCI